MCIGIVHSGTVFVCIYYLVKPNGFCILFTNAQIIWKFYSISITEMQTTNGINSQLSITHSDRQDSGVYKCVAENPFGKSEYIIYVAVQGMYSSDWICSLLYYGISYMYVMYAE